MIFMLSDGWMRVGRLAAEVAVSQLWQGAAVAAGLAVCLRLAPRTRASHRFVLWLAAFALVIALPAVPWLVRLGAGAASTLVAGQASSVAAGGAGFRLDERWGLAVVAAWALLAAVRLVALVAGAVRARLIWKKALPLEGLLVSYINNASSGFASGAWASAALAMRGGVELCRSGQVERPSVIGFFRPRVLIPDWLVGKLTEAELRQIVLHEVEHLRRLDDWSNLGLKLAGALLPLNPALVWMERRLDREREMACDEAVVRRTRAPKAYAACLASVAERRLQVRMGQRAALELGAWRRRPELAERILSLLRAKETLGPVGRAALAGTMGAGLLAAVVALAQAPQLVAFAPVAPAAEPVAAVQRVASEGSHEPVEAAVVLQHHRQAPIAAVAAEDAQPEVNAAQAVAIPVVARMEPVAAEAQEAKSGWVLLTALEEHVQLDRNGAVGSDYVVNTEQAIPINYFVSIGSGSVVEADLAARLAAARSAVRIAITGKKAAHVEPVWKLIPAAPAREGWMFFEL